MLPCNNSRNCSSWDKKLSLTGDVTAFRLRVLAIGRLLYVGWIGMNVLESLGISIEVEIKDQECKVAKTKI